jgi:hypothetical protein
MENAGVANGVIKLIINDEITYQLKKRKKEKFKFNKNHDAMSTFLNKRIRVNAHNHTPLKLYQINIMKIKTPEIKNPIKLIISLVMSTFSIHHLTTSIKMIQGFDTLETLRNILTQRP